MQLIQLQRIDYTSIGEKYYDSIIIGTIMLLGAARGRKDSPPTSHGSSQISGHTAGHHARTGSGTIAWFE